MNATAKSQCHYTGKKQAQSSSQPTITVKWLAQLVTTTRSVANISKMDKLIIELAE